MEEKTFTDDYNDRFSTPIIAYTHIASIISSLHPLTIYDPYFCIDTVTPSLSSALSNLPLPPSPLPNIINRNRDFYADIANNTLPPHDILVTNPPYSSDHKEKAMDFVINRNADRPFFCLMPSYVANRKYYKDLISEKQNTSKMYKHFFVVPKTRYEYNHPENTGHETSPFFSIWFCGNVSKRVLEGVKIGGREGKFDIVKSLHELESRNVEGIRGEGEKRLSSKRRKKLRKKKEEEGEEAIVISNNNSNDNSNNESSKKRKKNSKHRDLEGKRNKKRF